MICGDSLDQPRTNLGPTGLVQRFSRIFGFNPNVPSEGGLSIFPLSLFSTLLFLLKRMGGRVSSRNHSGISGPTGVGPDQRWGWSNALAGLAAALASTGCTPTDETFALGTLTGAILGAAAALWRVRTTRTAQTPADALESHWRGVARGRR
jgi:hypothetical protein